AARKPPLLDHHATSHRIFRSPSRKRDSSLRQWQVDIANVYTSRATGRGSRARRARMNPNTPAQFAGPSTPALFRFSDEKRGDNDRWGAVRNAREQSERLFA